MAPAFYTRDDHGVPTGWIAKMRASMGRLTPQFSTNRVVREYTETYYLPSAASYRARAADKGALGTELVSWRRALAEHWRTARFGAIRVETRGGAHHVMAEVHLGGLAPEMVCVELYADPIEGREPACHALTRGRKIDGVGHAYEFDASVPATRPAGDYSSGSFPSIQPLRSRSRRTRSSGSDDGPTVMPGSRRTGDHGLRLLGPEDDGSVGGVCSLAARNPVLSCGADHSTDGCSRASFSGPPRLGLRWRTTLSVVGGPGHE